MMMSEELFDFYFHKALEYAKGDDLTKAIQYVSISLGLDEENESAWRLAGLCYYALGNYTMAEQCFKYSPHYMEQAADSIFIKRAEMAQVKQLVDKMQYKKAIRILAADNDKSVLQWNYLGCLYGILRKKEKALTCFSEALRKDSGNLKTIFYLQNVQYMKEKRWWALELL